MNIRVVKKTLKYAAIILLSLIILIVGGAFVVGYFYSDKVTTLVISELNKRIDTEVTTDKVSFSVLKKFPNASIEFENITIKSSKNIHKNDFKKTNADTLLQAKSLFLEFNIIDIIKENYTIKKINIENGKINILTDFYGEDNFQLWRNEIEKDNSSLKFELKDLQANNTKINIRNLIKGFDLRSNVKKFKLSGAFGSEAYFLESNFTAYIKRFAIDNIVYISEREVTTDVEMKVIKDTYSINRGKLNIAGMRLDIAGTINNNEKTEFDLNFKGKDLNIKTFLSLLPDQYTKNIDDYESSGRFYFDCVLKGELSKYKNPKIDVKFGVENGNVKNKKSNLELNNISLTGLFSNGDKHSSATSFIKFENLKSALGKSEFSGNLIINNFLNPLIQLALNTNLDLAEINNFFPIDSVEKINGNAKVLLKYSGKFTDFKNISEKDIQNSQLEGDIELSNMNLKLKSSNYDFTNFYGKGNFVKNNLSIESLNFMIGKNDFAFQGNLKNILNYILLENQNLKMNGKLSSENFILDEFIHSSESSSEQAILPKDIAFNLDINVKNFTYDKFVANQLSGAIYSEGSKLVAQNVLFSTMQGNVNGDAAIELKENGSLHFQCSANLQKIDVKKLFYTFDNFGQSFILDKNLNGKISAAVDYSSTWDKNLNIIPESVLCDSKLEITNGELIDFEPMTKLSSYIEVSELKHVKFSTLKNEIIIKDRIVTIPLMDINSTAFNIQASGTHNFDNEFTYRVKVLLSELLAKNAKKAKKENDEFSYVEDDGLGKTSIYLIIKGNPDNYKISYDTKSVKENIKQNIKTEKQTIKQILKEEFGLFKNDTSLINKTKEDKKIDFNNQKVNIKWDEENPDKVNFDDD
ncbi:MAG: hypothetical protein A2033_18490 [Bacteroidetes bacterium GWA2_31_9]|nr:MAG: hypothetical protein A2033_18490 [Bacteroidetes bacterium GWA2_31_9]